MTKTERVLLAAMVVVVAVSYLLIVSANESAKEASVKDCEFLFRSLRNSNIDVSGTLKPIGWLSGYDAAISDFKGLLSEQDINLEPYLR